MAGTYQVIITPSAEKDLEDILNFLLAESSHQRAVEMQRAILEAIYGLAEMPTAHPPVKEVAGLTDMVYRRVIAKKAYRIIYRIEETDQQVIVIRILHVKRGPDFVKKRRFGELLIQV